LVFSEAAEEQYRLQAEQVPHLQNTQSNMPLGSGHRQFDPSRSETLRAIQEDEYYQQNPPQQYNQQFQTQQNYPAQNQQYLSNQFYDKVNVREQQPPQQVTV
jgi:alkaline phosphatase